MVFSTAAPDPRLAELVHCYWRLDGLDSGETYVALPKRHLELVVNVGAAQLAGAATGAALLPYSTCWLTVFRDRPLYLVPTGASVLFGVRFKDFAIPEWLASRPSGWVRSRDLSGWPQSAVLVHGLSRCCDIGEAAADFDRFFLDCESCRPAAPALARAARRCDAEDRLQPADILCQAGGTPRAGRALAKRASGISIRRFARLARFDRALVALSGPGAGRIADVAHSAGYYDEAHMAHDFAALCGTTPARFRRAHPGLSELPHHLYRR